MINNIAFVCTGNICRSPMGAALFDARLKQRGRSLRVISAGIAALVGYPPPPPVISLMAERGIDVSAHRAQQFTGELASECDLILVMEQPQQRFIEQNWVSLKGRVRGLGSWRNQTVMDPYGLPDEYYANCLALIDACIDDWEERLLA